MKTVRLLFGMVVVFLMTFAPTNAEAHRGNGGNHGHYAYNPYWVPGYVVRANMRHVYFPEYEMYFDRWNGTYIYLNHGRWQVSVQIPFELRRVNFGHAYMVGVGIDTARPYVYRTQHRYNYRRHYRQPKHDHGYYHSYKKGHAYGHHKGKKGHEYGLNKRKDQHDGHWENGRRNDQSGNRNNGRRGGRRN